ncbi:reverse transcriptase-like protein [Elysia marginata]|uniref:Reverse transcriptase-like protein n=1 Tax=Elysia marginata TaxID=1093978 RepID=A0AAV4F7M4_9GAST|nr:reverse transcriptase-like protein [Elysia marginata]
MADTIMRFGVPQGSFPGLVVFTLHTQPLVEILQQHNMSYHYYADDTQLYKGDSPKHITDITMGLEHCVRDVKAWMNRNKLKHNDNKTKILLMKSSRQTINTPSVSINHTIIDMAEKAKNLGVIFDSDCSMQH